MSKVIKVYKSDGYSLELKQVKSHFEIVNRDNVNNRKAKALYPDLNSAIAAFNEIVSFMGGA